MTASRTGSIFSVAWQHGQVTAKAIGFAGWAIKEIVLHVESTRERSLTLENLGGWTRLRVWDFVTRAFALLESRVIALRLS